MLTLHELRNERRDEFYKVNEKLSFLSVVFNVNVIRLIKSFYFTLSHRYFENPQCSQGPHTFFEAYYLLQKMLQKM